MKLRRVAIMLIENLPYNRGMIWGVAEYGHAHGWDMLMARNNRLDGVWLWEVDGFVAHVLHPEAAQQYVCMNAPTVNVSAGSNAIGLPRVWPDNLAVGRMAAEHLLGCGRSHYAVAYSGGMHFMNLRRDGFVEVMRAAGKWINDVDLEKGSVPRQDVWREWLQRLPKPVGIFAGVDDMALEILNACRELQLEVPGDVAILGVDNTPGGAVPRPGISTIELPLQAIGYEAAALLDRLINGAPAPAEPILLPPTGVIVRGSTQTGVWRGPSRPLARTALT